jgi:hypothetical protein
MMRGGAPVTPCALLRHGDADSEIVTNTVGLSVTDVTLARRKTNRCRWILQSSEQHC